MHAYDTDKLTGKTIFVRQARDGETMKALNGESYTLTAADLVIADGGGAIGLAGSSAALTARYRNRQRASSWKQPTFKLPAFA